MRAGVLAGVMRIRVVPIQYINTVEGGSRQTRVGDINKKMMAHRVGELQSIRLRVGFMLMVVGIE
jgi:hypothetical protein